MYPIRQHPACLWQFHRRRRIGGIAELLRPLPPLHSGLYPFPLAVRAPGPSENKRSVGTEIGWHSAPGLMVPVGLGFRGFASATFPCRISSRDSDVSLPTADDPTTTVGWMASPPRKSTGRTSGTVAKPLRRRIRGNSARTASKSAQCSNSRADIRLMPRTYSAGSRGGSNLPSISARAGRSSIAVR